MKKLNLSFLKRISKGQMIVVLARDCLGDSRFPSSPETL